MSIIVVTFTFKNALQVVLLIEAIQTISSLVVIFFDEKISRGEKYVTSKNQLTKQNKLTLSNKGNNFSHAHKLLSVTCFCARKIFS